MKKPLRIFIAILIFVSILLIARNIIIKSFVQKGVATLTGLRLSMGRLDIGLFKPYLSINNLIIYNPQEIKDRVMIDIPEIYIDYDLPSILNRNIHLPIVKINLNRFNVIKTTHGQMNIDSLIRIKERFKGSQESEESKNLNPSQLQIDQLNLSIGTVIYKDYSSSSTDPKIREFPININEQYNNITNPKTLVTLIVFKSLAKTTIMSLADFDLSGMQGIVNEPIKAVGGMKEIITDIGSKAIKDTSRIAEEAGPKASKLLKDILDPIQQNIP